MATIADLIGKTFERVVRDDDGGRLAFVLPDGSAYVMFHYQDCCEHVYLEDVVGNLDDLAGAEILRASEDTNSDEPAKEHYDDCFQWTFYNITSTKGTVTLRWYGESNGYYSVSVDMELTKPGTWSEAIIAGK